MVAEQVIAQWVMEARRSTVSADMSRGDVVHPAEAAEAGSEASVVPPPTEPNVVPTTAELSAVIPTTTELPSSSSTVPSADDAGGA